MKQKKITRNPPKRQDKDKPNIWKKKAVFRRGENERLRKRINELKISRENWKEKYQSQKSQKKRKVKAPFIEGEKASQHQYSLSLIVLVIELYKYGGMSLRSCRHSIS